MLKARRSKHTCRHALAIDPERSFFHTSKALQLSVPVQGRIRHRRPAPHFVGPLRLFRFSLEQASLRAGEGYCLLRSIALRSFLDDAPAVPESRCCDDTSSFVAARTSATRERPRN